MTTITKSVTRLLAERKALESRISKSSQQPFIGISKGNSGTEVLNYAGLTVADAAANFKGNLDKVNGLIAYYSRITSALILSNATVEVVIGGKTMKVAEAIERKKSIIFERTLLANLINQASHTQSLIDQGNVRVEDTIERQLVALYGGDKAKVTPENRAELSKSIKAAQGLAPIDPNNIAVYGNKKLEELNAFLVEVDFVLSEINAKTEITIEDETSV